MITASLEESLSFCLKNWFWFYLQNAIANIVHWEEYGCAEVPLFTFCSVKFLPL